MCSALDSSTESAQEGLSNFFDFIWANTEGYVYLPTLNRQTDEWHKVFFEWPTHKDHIIKHVLSGSAKGLDVYYGPALFKKGAKKPTKENVLGTHVLWTEFDGAAPTFAEDGDTPAPSNGSAPGSEAHSAVPAPSMRVQSSKDGHEHVYWKLDEFCEDLKWFEDRNRSITYSFRADTSGWDAVQILRPPYTSNYKKHDNPRPVTVAHFSGAQYPVAKFEPLKPPPQLVTEAIDIGQLPEVEGIIAKYRWDEEHFKMFMDPAIPEGQRSSALMRLGYFCIETGMTNEEAYAVLWNADERWGKYKGRNDQKRRLVDIIDRARQKHPNPTSELTFRGLTQEEDVSQGRPLVYGFKDFLASDVHVEWVFEGLLEKGGFGMIASMPGVGKTQVSIQLGMCAALGIDFLHWKNSQPRKVVVFSLEMSHVALKMFMETIAGGYTEEQHEILQENFFLIPLGEALSIERPEILKFVETILDEIQPDGLIFDSVGKLAGGDLSDKNAMMLNNRFAHLRSRYNGAFIWLIHHNRKASENNKKPVNLEDVYGNVYLTTDMTSVLILWKDAAKKGVEVIPVKNRLASLDMPFFAHRTEHLTFYRDEEPTFSGLNGEKEEVNDGDSKPDSRGGILSL